MASGALQVSGRGLSRILSRHRTPRYAKVISIELPLMARTPDPPLPRVVSLDGNQNATIWRLDPDAAFQPHPVADLASNRPLSIAGLDREFRYGLVADHVG